MSIDRTTTLELVQPTLRTIRRLPTYSDTANLRRDFVREAKVLRKRAKQVKVDPSTADDWVFALAALLDERALEPSSSFRTQWLSEPLQYVLFGEMQAGNSYFVRLQRAISEERVEAVAVFHWLLMLGFTGRFAIDGRSNERASWIRETRRYLKAKSWLNPSETVSLTSSIPSPSMGWSVAGAAWSASLLAVALTSLLWLLADWDLLRNVEQGLRQATTLYSTSTHLEKETP